VSTAVEEEVVSSGQEPYSVRLAAKHASGGTILAPHERRLYARRRDFELDWIRTARLPSAGAVSLVDLSAGGALIDTNVPLRPGAVLSLELVGSGIEATVTLQVLRSHVAALGTNGARYRGACEFTRPLELPGLQLLPDYLDVGADPFASVDAALKHLVERACATDLSQRLAPGDVVLMLQALARRALSGVDPFGRQLGNLLEELLPACRPGQTLDRALTTIERQLCQVLPQLRLRIVDGMTPPPPGMKSVLINPPGTLSASVPVSIDLPSAGVISDSQARLLRTSSRVIILVQRLNAHTVDAPIPAGDRALSMPLPAPAAEPSRAPDPEPSGTSGIWQKVVVRYADGQLLKGFTQDFHGSKSQFSLWPSITAAAHERIVVPLARLKAVFFVREFAGNPHHVEQKVFAGPAHGRRIEVTLLDDEVLVGTTLNYRSDSTGFFISPADPGGNNLRVFVVPSAVRQLRFP
jgi:hypothetical protein